MTRHSFDVNYWDRRIDNIQPSKLSKCSHYGLGPFSPNDMSRDHWLFKSYGVLTARIPHFDEWISNPENVRNVTDVQKVVRQASPHQSC